MNCKKAAAVIAGIVMAMGAASPAFADADAYGAAIGSPGVLSGNVVQVPIHAPINVCGNSVNVIGVLNPAVGNFCGNF
ncbi:chaplin [Streptomyces sp. NBC_00090]|uniref:chaplin n=1 Tax=Streptomyces sp. NBC_00090 TaxID=2903619 RepID=UPI0038692309